MEQLRLMKNSNKKRLKVLYTILLIVLVMLSAIYMANIASKANYEEAMSRLNALLSDPGFSPKESIALPVKPSALNPTYGLFLRKTNTLPSTHSAMPSTVAGCQRNPSNSVESSTATMGIATLM